ncbi:TldD/PmbA family protein [Cyanobacterium aponinum]|uniref:TldD/PmbA family protein n=1 Tax=Cyanobacterium aponinum 0216 TaxID=2676140 RepID=A0A844GUT1_9CHRO|nr:metallopeptidase TldD-related protein [Cyanobacterium aponinum]MTF37816.1 TldD/PmbA family protein [Cyanobacterium aponinum 0216]
MSNFENKYWELSFNSVSEKLFNNLKEGEYLIIQLTAEKSHFIRFNHAKVRQTGMVIDAEVSLKLISSQKTAYANFPLTGNEEIDLSLALENLDYLRSEIKLLPEDPYIVLPQYHTSSHEVYPSNLLNPKIAIESILKPVQGLDFTGYYAGGLMIRANYNSLGQKHWFATDSFFIDYSLINHNNKAIKGTFSARDWDFNQYQHQINWNKKQLEKLNLPIHEVKPGNYRTYLAPSAIASLLGMFSWGAISEASLQQGGSALAKMRQEENLSVLFSLKENFESGNVPRFNDLGEVSPNELPLIESGKLVNTLINSRTALEYNLTANGANNSESLRSPEIKAGSLKEEEILKNLDTGLYLSNLHYLNWSDRSSGRITGMTRYGCFWVEKGEIVATIKDLRFDDSLYSFFGHNLIALTDFREFIPEVSTYESRSLGGCLVPGALVNQFTFTL